MTENIIKNRVLCSAERIAGMPLAPLPDTELFFSGLNFPDTAIREGFLGDLRRSFAGDVNVGMVAKPFCPDVVFFDMDATAVEEESMVELAALAGKEEAIAKMTREAMEGGLDYTTSFKKRVELLAGTPVSMIEQVTANLKPRQGLKKLTEAFLEREIPFYLVTGGLSQFAERVVTQFGFESFRANDVEIVDGVMTGRVLGEVVDGEKKAQWVKTICEDSGFMTDDALALGDGANDIEMMKTVGVRIGVQPKAALHPFIDCYVGNGDLAFLEALLFR